MRMPDSNAKIPVPRVLLRRLWMGVGGGALFFGASLLQGASRADYDPWHQALSALSLGSGGWIQAINFMVLGFLMLSTAPTWRQVLAGGRSSTSFPLYTAVAGLSFMVLGLIPQDPAPGYDPAGLQLEGPTPRGLMHLTVAAVVGFSLTASLFVMARRFDGDANWHGWRAYTRRMAFIMIGAGAVYAVWSTKASGFAGAFEQLAFLVPFVFTGTLLRRLGEGVPFMVESQVPDRPSFPR
jgi:hypothetical protein